MSVSKRMYFLKMIHVRVVMADTIYYRLFDLVSGILNNPLRAAQISLQDSRDLVWLHNWFLQRRGSIPNVLIATTHQSLPAFLSSLTPEETETLASLFGPLENLDFKSATARVPLKTALTNPSVPGIVTSLLEVLLISEVSYGEVHRLVSVMGKESLFLREYEAVLHRTVVSRENLRGPVEPDMHEQTRIHRAAWGFATEAIVPRIRTRIANRAGRVVTQALHRA